MPYSELASDGTVRRHSFTPQVVSRRLAESFALTERHLKDAQVADLSVDAKHNIAYAAARVLAEAVMLAEGFRPGRTIGTHVAVFAFLKLVGQGIWAQYADYLDACRRKRNVAEYEMAGTISEKEANDLTEAATRFSEQARTWLGQHHHELMD